MKKVAVIGAGMTLFRRRLMETPKELCFEATRMALESAGIERSWRAEEISPEQFLALANELSRRLKTPLDAQTQTPLPE